MTGVLVRRDENTGTHRVRPFEQTAIHKTRKGAAEDPAWDDFSLQNHEKINFCCLSHLVYGTCFSRLSELIQMLWNFLHTQLCICKWKKQRWFFYLPFRSLSLISLSCLFEVAKSSSITLKNSVVNGHPYLAPNLMGKAFSLLLFFYFFRNIFYAAC